MRGIRTLFEWNKEHYFETIRISNGFDDNFIECERNDKDKNKTLSIDQYINDTKSYLCKIINDHKTQVERKIQLTIAINFLSSKDSGEMPNMHSKSDNIEIMIGNEKNGFIEDII